MTIIAAIKTGSNVIMGGDSLAIGEYYTANRIDRKIFKNGAFLIGGAGSYRAIQLLQFNNSIKKLKPCSKNPFQFMVNHFIPAFKNTLIDGGYAKRTEDIECNFLVAFDKNLFVIDSDYQVAEYEKPFTAIGFGRDLALGSLYSTSKETNHGKRIKLALEATEYYSASVRRPWIIYKT